MTIFLDPHGDDGALFAAFTIQRIRPVVAVVFDSYIQPARGIPGCECDIRREESAEAMEWLLVDRGEFLGFRDDLHHPEEVIAMALRKMFHEPTDVYAPAFEQDGHEQHNLAARAADLAFPGRVRHYLTYTRSWGRSRGIASTCPVCKGRKDYGGSKCYDCGGCGCHIEAAIEVLPRSADEIQRKLKALACFRSQMQTDHELQGTWSWFMGDFKEYVIP